MIKVLELIDGGFLGGGQTHILSLVKNLNRQKFKAIIAASPDGQYKNEVLNYRMNFSGIYLPKIFRTKHLEALNGIVSDNKIDIIHSHGGVGGMYSRFYKKRSGNIKVIHTIHGIHYTRTKNFVRRVFSHSIEQHLVPYTDKFICVSEGDYVLASGMKIIDPVKTVIIKNGIDLEKFSPREKDKNLVDELGITDSDLVLGNVSRFDYQKNQRLLIKIFPELLKAKPEIKLLLIGDGQFQNNCRESAKKLGIEDKVIFTGEISNVEKYYPLIDIFLFPSLWEGLSITLIEAMASGRCIIASKVPSNAELISDGYSGMLFDLHNEQDLIKKIEDLMANKSERDRLSRNAEAESKNYNEREMTQEVEKIYSEIIH